MQTQIINNLRNLLSEWEEMCNQEGKDINTIEAKFSLVFNDCIDCLELTTPEKCIIYGLRPYEIHDPKPASEVFCEEEL